MADRPITSTPAGAVTPGAPPRPRVAAAPAVAEAPAADRLVLAPTAPAIEADLQLAMAGSPQLVANGTVRVREAFITRYVESMLSDKRLFPTMDVRFDADAACYASQGTVKLFGIPFPMAFAARPSTADGQLAIAFDAPRLRLLGWQIPLSFLAGPAADVLVTQLRYQGIAARRTEPAGKILIEPGSLMRQLGLMPSLVSLDTRRTAMTLTLGPTGDVEVALAARDVPAPATSTPRSDLALRMDDRAVTAVLRQALNPDYLLGQLKFREGGLTASGKADAKPLSDLMTLGKGLMILAAFYGSGGSTPAGLNGDPVVVRVDLDVDVRLEGQTMVVKPSIARASKEILTLLENAKVPARARGDEIVVDLQAAARTLGAELRRLRIDEHGVLIDASVDVERLLRDKRLLAP